MVVVFGNVTNNTTPWKSEPNFRGSYDILSNCIVTISLCAWTALHLNVPEHGTAGRQWLRKTKWLGLGLAAPEMVVYVAWRQRQEAKRLLRDVRKHLGQMKQPSFLCRLLGKCHLLGRRSPKADRGMDSAASSPSTASVGSRLLLPDWTLAHGFYAVMGGFAFDTSDASEVFLPGCKTRATVTASGLRFLLDHEPDLLPDISKEQIEDKSKADGLKKFLVCVQATWFCASCISRLASSLPISLLELNAMGHAACALLIYAMWWQKPLDIAEPTLIQGYQAHRLLAFMWMSSHVSAEGLKSQDFHGRLRDEFDALWIYQQPNLDELIFKDFYSSDMHPNGQHVDTNAKSQPTPRSLKGRLDPYQYPMSFRHYASEAPLAMRYRSVNWLHSKKYLSSLGVRFPAGLGVRKTGIDHISPIDVVRWRLAHEAIQRYHLEEEVRVRHARRSYVYDQDSRVQARIGNFLPLRGSRPFEVWLGFAVAGLLYGGLHMLAWNAPFSSDLEQILWRVAASSVTTAPLILTPIALIFGNGALIRGVEDLTTMFRGHNVERVDGRAEYWARVTAVLFSLPFFAVSPLLWFTYVLGRVYLVVECFRNVAHLPEGVFQKVSWSGYVPHIT